MLAQEIGTHSNLLTFEHVEDAAFRATMVVDRRLGAITKTQMSDELTILTEIRLGESRARTMHPSFEPITGWGRPDH